MSTTNQYSPDLPNSSFSDSKKHYPILDGLRGVAALVVVAFHFFETYATSRFDQIINHGYLAVDFFFLLSGFVIAYAYDDRWNTMSTGEFFKRRLIRLHPMIIFGMAMGAFAFYFQGGQAFPLINETPVWQMLLVMVIGMALIPLPPSMDVRGWGEMYPLNGPAWSLFFEYLANIFYALFLRRLSNTLLVLLALAAGCTTLYFALTDGGLAAGWALTPEQTQIGFVRLMYPFLAGLLLARLANLTQVRHAFPGCGLLLVIIFVMPRIGDENTLWMNGLYEALCILVVFPLIVYVGASGELKEGISVKLCAFLGGISYPLYIIHYPVTYTFMAWVRETAPSSGLALSVAVCAILLCVALAHLCLMLYDIPVRKWLGNHYTSRGKGTPGDAAKASKEKELLG